MSNLFVGVLKLDPQTYEDIEHNPQLLPQAAIIVAVAAVMMGIYDGNHIDPTQTTFMQAFVGKVIGTFLGWLGWAYATLKVASGLFKQTDSNMGEMLRVLGFAHLPILFYIVPAVGPLVGAIWCLATTFVAVRQGLELTNMQTVATVILGAIVYVILAMGIAILTAMVLAPFVVLTGG